jgi:hypothetical protein
MNEQSTSIASVSQGWEKLPEYQDSWFIGIYWNLGFSKYKGGFVPFLLCTFSSSLLWLYEILNFVMIFSYIYCNCKMYRSASTHILVWINSLMKNYQNLWGHNSVYHQWKIHVPTSHSDCQLFLALQMCKNCYKWKKWRLHHGIEYCTHQVTYNSHSPYIKLQIPSQSVRRVHEAELWNDEEY